MNLGAVAVADGIVVFNFSNKQRNSCFGVRRIITSVLLALLLSVSIVKGPSLSQSQHSKIMRVSSTTEKVCALTFDDGPHPRFTPEILATLDKYNVKATFFMVGSQMEQHPDIVEEVLKRGNVIGNHTYSHPHNLKADSQAQIEDEIAKCDRVIETMTGQQATLFRPPRGLVNESIITVADEEGYRTILWTVCADHHDARSPQAMAKRVLDHIRPGAIILIHDGMTGIRWRDAAATPLIIQELKQRGYRFVTVPALLAMDRQKHTSHLSKYTNSSPLPFGRKRSG